MKQDTRLFSLRFVVLSSLLFSFCLWSRPVTGVKAQAARMVPTAFDCAAVSEIPLVECRALVAIYNSMDGSHWPDDGPTAWLTTTTPCGWAYVTCTQQHVTKLHFYFEFWLAENPGLTGSLPPEIGNLPNLQEFLLDCGAVAIGAVPYECTNRISLPVELGELTQLRSLTLANDQVTTLPFDLVKLVNLQDLDLHNNQFTRVPAGLDQITTLQALYLRGNQLTNVSSALGTLINLQWLDLSSNQLTTVPAELGNLTKLEGLLLGANLQLRGPFPSTFVQLKALTFLGVWQTGLCEPTNLTFQAWLTHVQYLGDQAVPCLKLRVNFSIGAPGSQFAVIGSTFFPTDTLTLSVNRIPLGSVPPDAIGQFTITLASPEAASGAYVVTVANPIDDVAASFRLASDAPLRTPVGASTFAIPTDIAYTRFGYLPILALPNWQSK